LCVLLVVPPLRLRKPVEALRRTAKPDAGSALLEVAEVAKQTCRVADQIPLRNAW
jgi:hypothetical protein